MMRYVSIDSPVGTLTVAGDGNAVSTVLMGRAPDPEWTRDASAFGDAVEQLNAYFAGELTSFDLDLAARGTEFQHAVWRALLDIPYGETASYSQIAACVGKPSASRAVGMANARNPIGIVVPCHRVIGASGTLTGYAGGLDRKRWLLEHEARVRAAE